MGNDHMKKIQLDFGVEEFAVSMSMFERPEEAKGLLISALGEISPEEERGRLLAAYNSLFARGLIAYSNQHTDPALHSDIKAMLNLFFGSQTLIRVSKISEMSENTVSYYSCNDGWLEHCINEGVSHRFSYPLNEKEITKRISAFLSPQPVSSAQQSLLLKVPTDILFNAPAGTLSNYDELLSILSKDSEVTDEMKMLADDIVNGQWRASTVWISHPDTEQLLMKGYLWVQGAKRLWKLNSDSAEQSEFLDASLCSQGDFPTIIKNLVRTNCEAKSM
jgi:hypothetical protein